MRAIWIMPVVLACSMSGLAETPKPKDKFAPPEGIATPAPTSEPAVKPMNDDELTSHILPRDISPDARGAVSLIYNGARRSQINPCGCASGPLGGIDREARVISHIEGKGIPTVKVDAGGFLKDSPSDNAIKTAEIVLQALGEMKYSVVNVGYIDLGAGVKFIRDLGTSASLKFISANLLDASGKEIFPPYEIVPVKLRSGEEVKFGFIGLTRARMTPGGPRAVILDGRASRWIADEPGELISRGSRGMGDASTESDTDSFTVGDKVEALKKHLPDMKAKCDVAVLLIYEKRPQVQNFLESLPDDLAVDIVVAGDHAGFFSDILPVNNMKVVVGGYEGRQVGLTLMDIENTTITKAVSRLLDIPQSVPPLAEFTKYIEENAKATKVKGAAEVKNRPGVTQIYGAVGACQSCHKAEFEQWETTRHAIAMKTLLDKNQQYNHDCLKCHVTGYKDQNGFTDFRLTPQMGNVQCEVCHGPAQAHAVDKRMAAVAAQMGKEHKPNPDLQPLKMDFDEQFCMRCHDKANDPDFDYKRDIQFVNHSRVGTRDKHTTAAK